MAFVTVSAFAFADATDWQSLGGQSGAEPQVALLESDNSHLVAEVSVPGFWFGSFPANGRVWDTVTLPGHYPIDGFGEPELPMIANLFALPYGTEAVVTIEDVQYVTYGNLSILPRQTAEIDMAHDPYPFIQKQALYQTNELTPSAWATVAEDGYWAGLHVASLRVCPFRYNPVTGDLLAVSSMTVRVDFTGSPEATPYTVSPDFAPAMASQVINWADFRDAVVDGRAGTEYLVVANSTTWPAVKPLIEMHHSLGLQCKLLLLSNPATSASIKTAIADNFETGVTRFAIIAGDNTAMPAYTGYGGGVLSDYYYTLLTGGDNYPEFAIGRLTGDVSQITHQVDKIMDGYVFYGYDDGNTTGVIPSETILAAHQEQYPGKYTQCCNEIAAYPYSLIDMTWHKIYPPEGGTNQMIINLMNSNTCGNVTYRGHGDVTIWAWSAPSYWTTAMSLALTNTFMPPVFNIACLCGAFAPAGTCLAEAWQWSNGGASGNLSAYVPSYTIPNHDYIKQYFIATYDDGLFRVMEAVNYATVWIIDNHGSLGIDNARMYFWFGDPGMDIYTFDETYEPAFILCDAPYSVDPGSQTINIVVTADGSPLSGATVALSDGIEGTTDGMTFYEEGTTNASGQVSFTVTVPSTGTLLVGAYKHDYVPDTDVIYIGTGTEEGQGAAIMSDLSLGMPAPNPVSVSAAIDFSVPSTGRVELAVYDLSGHKTGTIIDGVIVAGVHSVTWQPDSRIANGVYFLRLTTESGTITRQLMVVR
jgi:hypothetical protein